MANRNLVAIGTSAGGVEALLLLARQLPRDLQAAIVITIHLPSGFRSLLDEVLNEALVKSPFAAVKRIKVSKKQVTAPPPGSLV